MGGVLCTKGEEEFDGLAEDEIHLSLRENCAKEETHQREVTDIDSASEPNPAVEELEPKSLPPPQARMTKSQVVEQPLAKPRTASTQSTRFQRNLSKRTGHGSRKGGAMRPRRTRTSFDSDPVSILKSLQLPAGEQFESWVFFHLSDFSEEMNMLYGMLASDCTPSSCPEMSAGSKYSYLWADKNTPTPVKLAAPHYIEALLEWVDDHLADPRIFPGGGATKLSRSNFHARVSQVFKRMFRFYAHVFHNHFPRVLELDAVPRLTCAFNRFVLFGLYYDLVPEAEVGAMAEMVAMLRDQTGVERGGGLRLEDEGEA